MSSVDSVQTLGQIFLPLNINGYTIDTSKPPHYYYFILDTGAGMSAVDQKIATNLQLFKIGQTELAGTAGVLQVPLVQVDTLTPLRRLEIVDSLWVSSYYPRFKPV
jgi:hypothetical protein